MKHPVDESFSGQDRGGCNSRITFGFSSLFQFNASSALQESPLDKTRISELVAEGPRAVRAEFEEIFNDSGMAPGKKAVQVAEFFVELVVALGADGDHRVGGSRGFADHPGEIADALVAADPFAVLNPVFEEAPSDLRFDVGACYD